MRRKDKIIWLVGIGLLFVSNLWAASDIRIVNTTGVTATPSADIVPGTTVILTINPPEYKYLNSIEDISVVNVADIGDIRAPRHAPVAPVFSTNPTVTPIEGESYGTNGAGRYQFTMGEHDVKITVTFHNDSCIQNTEITIGGTYTYNRMVQKPADENITVTFEGTELIKDADYTISYITDETDPNYTDYKSAGNHYVVITGINDFFGYVRKPYSINPKSINDFALTCIPEATWTGSAIAHPIIINDGEYVLHKDKDYTLSYNNNINPGIAGITITGKGDYTGVRDTTFEIWREITSVAVTGVNAPISNQALDTDAICTTAGVYSASLSWSPTEASGIAQFGTIYTATVTLTPSDYCRFAESVTVTGDFSTGNKKLDGSFEVQKTFDPTQNVFEVSGSPYVIGANTIKQRYMITNESNKTATLIGLSGSTTSAVTITITTKVPDGNGNYYTVDSIGEEAFNGYTFVKSIILESDSLLPIGSNAFKNINATIQTPLKYLDDYALNPELAEKYQAGKILTEVTPTTKLWTFSCGIDVLLPQNIHAYIIKEESPVSVRMLELGEDLLTTNRIIAANNGILFKGTAGEKYALTAHYNSGITSINANINALTYSTKNLLEPVIESRHFNANNNYYILYGEAFHSLENDDVPVPACKAVLRLPDSYQAKTISLVMNEPTSIYDSEIKESKSFVIYDLQGRRITDSISSSITNHQLPKGIYIINGKKIIK